MKKDIKKIVPQSKRYTFPLKDMSDLKLHLGTDLDEFVHSMTFKSHVVRYPKKGKQPTHEPQRL